MDALRRLCYNQYQRLEKKAHCYYHNSKHNKYNGEHPIKKRIPIFLVIAILTLGAGSCDVAEYPYYLKHPDLSNTKPVFIIVIDTSGSNNEYISSINQLANESRDYLLENLYNGDQDAMDEKFAIVNYSNGESWATALLTPPSQLNPQFTEDLDEYPYRVVLFYGNGGGATNTNIETYYQGCSSFIGTTYPDLRMYLGRLIITTPSDGSNYGPWADHLINGTEYTEYGYGQGSPEMSRYGWGYTEYNPSSIDNEAFLEDLMDSIREVY